jgi:hypothetical protein
MATVRRVGLAVLAAVAVAPTAASGATVLGSALSRGGDAPGYCTGDGPGAACTVLQLTLGSADQAVPFDGVLTRWATRDAGGELTVRVLEGPSGQRAVVASGPVTPVSGSGVQAFPLQISVRAGQRVGLELGESSFVPFFYRDEATTGEQYQPPLTAVPSAPLPDAALARTYEIDFSVTLEPDADRDGQGDETQDPDHGGCPPEGALATGGGSTVVRAGRRVSACRAGQTTALGTTSPTSRLRLFQLNGDWLALVRVVRGRSSVEVYDLALRRRAFKTTRTFSRVDPTRWTVTDLVVAPNGDAAWIATLRGDRARTTVWVRHGARVQQIDQGRIRPTSLTLSEDGSGVNYLGADGRGRNSSFS